MTLEQPQLLSTGNSCQWLAVVALSANSEWVLGEGVKMISRFVVVPAIPIETGSTRNGSRFYCQTAPIGFNVYDNQEKLRLKTAYQTRQEAEKACQRLNEERFESILSER